MKADTNELHAILLKKNVWVDIIKMILDYLPIAILETLKEWKVAITLVGQGYESMESWQEYRIGTETIYRGKGILMNIGNSRDNFKDRKPKCFNCNIYSYIAKEC